MFEFSYFPTNERALNSYCWWMSIKNPGPRVEIEEIELEADIMLAIPDMVELAEDISSMRLVSLRESASKHWLLLSVYVVRH